MPNVRPEYHAFKIARMEVVPPPYDILAIGDIIDDTTFKMAYEYIPLMVEHSFAAMEDLVELSAVKPEKLLEPVPMPRWFTRDSNMTDHTTVFAAVLFMCNYLFEIILLDIKPTTRQGRSNKQCLFKTAGMAMKLQEKLLARKKVTRKAVEIAMSIHLVFQDTATKHHI